MRYFVLIDLSQQAEFLPPEVRDWPPERFLGWLRLYGEVLPRPLDLPAHAGHPQKVITIWGFFPSSVKTSATTFVITKRGQFILLNPGFHQIWGEKAQYLEDLDIEDLPV